MITRTAATAASLFGLLVPRQRSLGRVVEVGARGERVDQPAQLGLLPRRGQRRDHEADRDVDDEGRTGGGEARALPLQPEHAGGQSARGRPVLRMPTTTAASVPLTRPIQAAVGLIRFQNMPRMKVANSGALKNPKRVCT